MILINDQNRNEQKSMFPRGKLLEAHSTDKKAAMLIHKGGAATIHSSGVPQVSPSTTC